MDGFVWMDGLCGWVGAGGLEHPTHPLGKPYFFLDIPCVEEKDRRKEKKRATRLPSSGWVNEKGMVWGVMYNTWLVVENFFLEEIYSLYEGDFFCVTDGAETCCRESFKEDETRGGVLCVVY